MLIDLKNEEGYVKAYIQFQVVDGESKICSDGAYLFVNGFWVHEKHRNEMKKILAGFIRKMLHHEETSCVAFIYWERDKNNKIVRFPAWKFVKRFLNIDIHKIGENNG